MFWLLCKLYFKTFVLSTSCWCFYETERHNSSRIITVFSSECLLQILCLFQIAPLFNILFEIVQRNFKHSVKLLAFFLSYPQVSTAPKSMSFVLYELIGDQLIDYKSNNWQSWNIYFPVWTVIIVNHSMCDQGFSLCQTHYCSKVKYNSSVMKFWIVNF